MKLDHAAEYPTEFVQALTDGGYLGCLIPEEYGGSGLPLSAGCAVLETIHEMGCNAAACHAQMYTMGTVLKHGSEEQKRKYLPDIASGKLRLQAFGVTEPTTGSDTTQLKTKAEKRGNKYVVNGQKVWTSACSSPTSCCCSRVRRRSIRSSGARMASPSSSSICAKRRAAASRSRRSTP
jgi:alkylation response protein AidB-like acyl-CoA dehydrogenase